MKVFFAKITKSAIGCSELLLFISTLNNTQFQNFNVFANIYTCFELLQTTFHDWGGGADDPDVSIDLTWSTATIHTPEILYIIRRNCQTSQGDTDSSFTKPHENTASVFLMWTILQMDMNSEFSDIKKKTRRGYPVCQSAR